MANTNAPFGLMPILPILHRQEVRLTAALGAAVYHQDPLVQVAAGTWEIATAGNANAIGGVVIDLFDSNGVPVHYAPAGVTGYTAVVADDPDQYFVAQDDGDTTQLALTDEGANVELIAGSGGSTTTGLSSWMVDSSSSGADASGQAKLIRQYPGIDNAIGAYCRWIIKINYHLKRHAVAGV